MESEMTAALLQKTQEEAQETKRMEQLIMKQKQKQQATIDATTKLLNLQQQSDQEEKILQKLQKELEDRMQRNKDRQRVATQWADELRIQKEKLD